MVDDSIVFNLTEAYEDLTQIGAEIKRHVNFYYQRGIDYEDENGVEVWSPDVLSNWRLQIINCAGTLEAMEEDMKANRRMAEKVKKEDDE